jgi:electron transfer flavoprotein alpha/beta subunit
MLKFLLPVVISINVFAMSPRMGSGEQMNEKHQKMKVIVEQTFSESDMDKNNSLNAQEFSVFNKKMKTTMEQNKPSDDEIFNMMDKNQDGVISKDELHPPMRGDHEKQYNGRI